MAVDEYVFGELDGLYEVGERLLGARLKPFVSNPENDLIEKVLVQSYGLANGALHARAVLSHAGISGMGAILGISKLTDRAFPAGSPFDSIALGVKASYDRGVVAADFYTAANPQAPLIEAVVDRRSDVTGNDYIATPDWTLNDPDQDEALRLLATPKIMSTIGSYAVSTVESFRFDED